MSMRLAAAILAMTLTACGAVKPTGPPGQASTTDVNPITGSRGGSGASSSK